MQIQFSACLKDHGEVGYVDKVLQSIAHLEGLPGVSLGEMVVFESGQLGRVESLAEDGVEVLVLAKEPIKVGTRVARSAWKMAVNVGENVLGRRVNVLGQAIDGLGELEVGDNWRDVDASPWGMNKRSKVDQPMVTGVALVDLLVPLGKGQRELVTGDRKTGKTYLLLQAMLSQAKQGSVCIYAAIGKKRTEIIKTQEFLKKYGIADRSVVVAASSQDSAGEIFLCPYTAMAIAENFRDKGVDTLVVMDDMSTHAKFYRELSLLSRKFPGRDSYPGDIFHVHSKLMERAGSFLVENKAVTLTCMPVVETVQGDIAGYIQTNMMSMTDGHIYFDSDLFFRGRRPAINPYVSVTRVGRQTQTRLRRDAGRMLLDLLNSYEKTQGFLRFGAELGENSRQILMMGDRVLGFFDQPMYTVVPLAVQLLLLAMLLSGLWTGKNMPKMVENYETDESFRQETDKLIGSCETMNKLIEEVRKKGDAWLAVVA